MDIVYVVRYEVPYEDHENLYVITNFKLAYSKFHSEIHAPHSYVTSYYLEKWVNGVMVKSVHQYGYV